MEATKESYEHRHTYKKKKKISRFQVKEVDVVKEKLPH